MLLIATSMPSLYLDRAASRRFREARLQEAAFPNYVFGDHAVAAVLTARPAPGDVNVTASWAGSDPANPLSWAVHLPGAAEHGYAIDFEAVARSYVPAIRDVLDGLRASGGRDPLAADRFYFHQANGALPLAAADALGIAREKLAMSARLRGNTSVASVPALIAEDLAAGRIGRGATICAAAVGAGAGFSGFLATVG
jgi:3-oxoacyl-[acyl-carrier-protein] synthase III